MKKQILESLKNFIKDLKMPENHITALNDKHIYVGQDGVDLIYKKLCEEKACMISEYETFETDKLNQFLKNKKGKVKFGNKSEIFENIGIFPPTDYMISRFCSELAEISKNIDILGINYKNHEFNIIEKYCKNCLLIEHPSLMERNIVSNNPWSRYLKGKTVLVVHPLVEIMEKQYKKRKVLFKNEDVLPDCNFIFEKPTQVNNYKNSTFFETWFQALEFKKSKIKQVNFDVALIDCEAYGTFLADYCKSLGKQALNIRGHLNLLFGIEDVESENISFYNEHWVCQ